MHSSKKCTQQTVSRNRSWPTLFSFSLLTDKNHPCITKNTLLSWLEPGSGLHCLVACWPTEQASSELPCPRSPVPVLRRHTIKLFYSQNWFQYINSHRIYWYWQSHFSWILKSVRLAKCNSSLCNMRSLVTEWAVHCISNTRWMFHIWCGCIVI